ncbi:MAG TPA: hypothetical protein VI981_02445 [Candidatus Paceibacterota bacterium]
MAQKKNKILVGAGIATLAALAGAYLLYGDKDGAARRKKIRGWLIKAKGEIIERLEKLEAVNEDVYNRIVEEVVKKYKKAKNVDPAEIQALVKDARAQWKNIRKIFSHDTKKAGRKRKAERRK